MNLGILIFPALVLNNVVATSQTWQYYIHEGCEISKIMAWSTIVKTSADVFQPILGREYITRPMLSVRSEQNGRTHYLDLDSSIFRFTMVPVTLFLSEMPVRAEIEKQSNETLNVHFEDEYDVYDTTMATPREIRGELVWTTRGNCTSGLPYEILSRERSGWGFKHKFKSDDTMEFVIISKEEQNVGPLQMFIYGIPKFNLCWNDAKEEIKLQFTDGEESQCNRLPSFIPLRLKITYNRHESNVMVNSHWYDISIPTFQFKKENSTAGEYIVVYCIHKCPELDDFLHGSVTSGSAIVAFNFIIFFLIITGTKAVFTVTQLLHKN